MLDWNYSLQWQTTILNEIINIVIYIFDPKLRVPPFLSILSVLSRVLGN